VKESTKRAIRTAVQTAFAVAGSAPILVSTVGFSTTAGFGAVLVTVAAVLSKLHAVPAVSSFLNKYFGVPE